MEEDDALDEENELTEETVQSNGEVSEEDRDTELEIGEDAHSDDEGNKNELAEENIQSDVNEENGLVSEEDRDIQPEMGDEAAYSGGEDKKVDVQSLSDTLAALDPNSNSKSDDEADPLYFVSSSRFKAGQGKNRNVSISSSTLEDQPDVKTHVNLLSDDDERIESSKTTKKKKRRAKKGGAAGGTATTKPVNVEDDDEEDDDEKTNDRQPSQCMVCNQKFPSRSKLFRHIKATGHAAPLTDVQQANTSKKNESGKAGKKKKGRGKDS